MQEAAIVGLPHERWGEAPHAFVVLRQGAQTGEAELRELRGLTSLTSKAA